MTLQPHKYMQDSNNSQKHKNYFTINPFLLLKTILFVSLYRNNSIFLLTFSLVFFYLPHPNQAIWLIYSQEFMNKCEQNVLKCKKKSEGRKVIYVEYYYLFIHPFCTQCIQGGIPGKFQLCSIGYFRYL